MLFVVAALLATGCPPPPLSLDEPDARDNAPPGITSVRAETGAEFKIGDFNIIQFGTGGQSTMTLTLADSDFDDTLYVRGFRDYTVTTHPPANAVCNVGPSDPRALLRQVTCSLTAYCPGAGEFRMDIVVSDRLPDDAGTESPPYYALAEAEPGLQATRTYQIRCEQL